MQRQPIRDLTCLRCLQLPSLKEARTTWQTTAGYASTHRRRTAPAGILRFQKFCSNLLCHVNLIPINAIEGSNSNRARLKLIYGFLKFQQERKLRDSRGSDISGACTTEKHLQPFATEVFHVKHFSCLLLQRPDAQENTYTK